MPYSAMPCHPNRPGPQPWNQIAATFEEQLARPQAGRQPEPYDETVARRLVATLLAYLELFGPVLRRLPWPPRRWAAGRDLCRHERILPLPRIAMVLKPASAISGGRGLRLRRLYVRSGKLRTSRFNSTAALRRSACE
jgi:hypothetical protein